jgi:hypothetical protein
VTKDRPLTLSVVGELVPLASSEINVEARRGTGEMSDSVPLRDVPEQFLDRYSWNEILSFAGRRQTALELLDAPNPDALPEFWDSAVPGSRLQDRRKVFQKGQILSFAFRERLFNGTHVAFGFSCGHSNRVPVPRERAIDLWPQFATERMVGQDIAFAQVTVIEAAKLNTPAAELLRRLMDWMQLQRAVGRRSKKVLQYEATVEFDGAQLTTRMFDTVYKAVFDSPRGHPSAKRL